MSTGSERDLCGLCVVYDRGGLGQGLALPRTV